MTYGFAVGKNMRIYNGAFYCNFYFYLGNYSRLAVEIQFQRSPGFTYVRVYVPCGMAVVLSWIAFWLDRRLSMQRVGIGLLLIVLHVIVS